MTTRENTKRIDAMEKRLLRIEVIMWSILGMNGVKFGESIVSMFLTLF